MKPSYLIPTLGPAALLAVGSGMSAYAQSWGTGPDYYGVDADYYTQLTHIRLSMMLFSTAAGFLLGWFFSPQAREVRRAIALIAGVLAIVVVIFDHGALGWGTAFVAVACPYRVVRFES